MPERGIPAPFGFTGELHSQGLVYLRARWYDGSAGTFTARDPFGGFPEQPYSLHPYGYANPGRWTDASGRCATGVVIDTVGCVIGTGLALPFTAFAGVALDVHYFFLDPNAEAHRHDLARGTAVAYAYPVEAISILTGWSTAEEVFGPPHTGHTGGIPTDLMPYGPPPTSVQLPPLPILGDLTPPSDRACFDQLPGTSLFPVSWEEYILPHPLTNQQSVTVVAMVLTDVVRCQQRRPDAGAPRSPRTAGHRLAEVRERLGVTRARLRLPQWVERVVVCLGR